jgi:hypothetical protein
MRFGDSGELRFAQVTLHQSAARTEAADYLLDRCLIEALAGLRIPGASEAEAVYSWVFAHR